ncbi:GNAT family N-acetyltransferase [Aquimarina sp. U1-2]|uniref:GNAT family N-acetyltransferase n=1 Tax=Aquimarina sp. U1-2 TaxID=2823141 RepID=UPI001AEC8C23|nr:GNAT family N-acetyltransferase [Aquimarina sp. U1-2]MBP2831947.1 GNAT family N-acetyltransferase [Aquimarina sp. U1-2]
MHIENSTIEDIPAILQLYTHAVAYQTKVGAVPWPQFTHSDIKKEIDAGQQWKIVIDNQIACVWMTTFDDPYIWEVKNKDPSVYIHRIATNPKFRGQHFVKKIITWAYTFAASRQKEFIRMDTAGHNEKLISYYTNCGFEFLGSAPLKNASKLPSHYRNTKVSLFQIKL